MYQSQTTTPPALYRSGGRIAFVNLAAELIDLAGEVIDEIDDAADLASYQLVPPHCYCYDITISVLPLSKRARAGLRELVGGATIDARLLFSVTLGELQRMPGVGPVTADEILDYSAELAPDWHRLRSALALAPICA
ncbi:MAG: hypothetical protein WCJ64_00840 [Rhodospirillaceae bacterium]